MSTPTQQGNHAKVRLQLHSFPIELDVCAWIHDEPDVLGSGFLQSGFGTLRRNFSGSGSLDCNTEVSGGHGVAGWTGSQEHTSDLIDQAAAQRKSTSSTLYAQLKGTTIKESILLEGIQRLGGGQKGLRGVVKAILFWLEAKNRRNYSKSSESCIANSELPSPPIVEMDQFTWSNLECASIVDAQQVEHFRNLNNANHASPTDPFTAWVGPTSSCHDNEGSLCNLKTGGCGSGEYGQVPNYEGQPHDFAPCSTPSSLLDGPMPIVSLLSSDLNSLPKI